MTTARTRLIRDYRHADWPAVAAAHDAARRQELSWSVDGEGFRTLAETADAEGLFDDRLWVAEPRDEAGEPGGPVVGFVAFSAAEITWLYVHPAHQGAGTGTALLRHALAHADALGLDRVQTTVIDGSPARRLYEREGFVLAETRTGCLVGTDVPATGHVLVRRA